MPEEVNQDPNNPLPRRRHRSRSSSSGRSRHRSSRHRRSSSSEKTAQKFTFSQALLLLWSACTLGGLLYLVEDVHGASITAIAALGIAAVVGLFFFFRGLRKKKKR